MKLITIKEFTEVIGGELVFVDFFAPWCSPCKMIAPKLEELEKTYGDAVKFFKVDIDDENNYELVTNVLQIRSVPTFIIYKNGIVKELIKGAQPITAIKAKIDSYL